MVEERPALPRYDQDALVRDNDYLHADPEVVCEHLRQECKRFAILVEHIPISQREIEPCYIRYQSPRDRSSTDYQPVSRRKKGDLLCQHRSLNALPPLTTIRYSSSTCFTPLWRPPPNRRSCIGIRVAIPTARCASVSVSWQVVLPA